MLSPPIWKGPVQPFQYFLFICLKITYQNLNKLYRPKSYYVTVNGPLTGLFLYLWLSLFLFPSFFSMDYIQIPNFD